MIKKVARGRCGTSACIGVRRNGEVVSVIDTKQGEDAGRMDFTLGQWAEIADSLGKTAASEVTLETISPLEDGSVFAVVRDQGNAEYPLTWAHSEQRTVFNFSHAEQEPFVHDALLGRYALEALTNEYMTSVAD